LTKAASLLSATLHFPDTLEFGLELCYRKSMSSTVVCEVM